LVDLSTFDSEYWDDGQGGKAQVGAKLECVGPWSLSVEKVRLIRKNGPHAKVLHCSLDEDEDDIASEWLPGDEFAALCHVSLAPEDEPNEEDAIAGPGEYELTWRRILPSGDYGPLSTSLFPLPLLRPPRDDVIALLDLPASAKLHVPIHAYLTIRNHHPTRTANVTIQLETDASDAFLAAGLRSGRVPTLLPGAEERMAWVLIPIECGFVRVPKIRVLEKRRATSALSDIAAPVEADGDVIIVDVRRDGRGGKGAESVAVAEGQGGRPPSPTVAGSSTIGPILVLP